MIENVTVERCISDAFIGGIGRAVKRANDLTARHAADFADELRALLAIKSKSSDNQWFAQHRRDNRGGRRYGIR